MFGFRRKKSATRIESINDFADARARELAITHNLSADEIFPTYRDLEAEVQANNWQIGIDPNVLQDETIRKLVCGAIISYELASREAMRFMDDGKIATIRRAVPAEVYASLGRYYEGIATRLDRGII